MPVCIRIDLAQQQGIVLDADQLADVADLTVLVLDHIDRQQRRESHRRLGDRRPAVEREILGDGQRFIAQGQRFLDEFARGIFLDLGQVGDREHDIAIEAHGVADLGDQAEFAREADHIAVDPARLDPLAGKTHRNSLLEGFAQEHADAAGFERNNSTHGAMVG